MGARPGGLRAEPMMRGHRDGVGTDRRTAGMETGGPEREQPRGVFAWRREGAAPASLTPIGRVIFPGGTMRLSGWRLALVLVEPAVNGLVVLFLLGSLALAIAGIGISTHTAGALFAATATAGFFLLAVIAYSGMMFMPSLSIWREGTWPASRWLVWRSDLWVDAVRRPEGGVRQLVAWRADCPACGAPLHLVSLDRRGATPPSAICTARPMRHRCTFDRTSLTGEWWIDRTRGGRMIGTGDWMDESAGRAETDGTSR